MIVFAISGQVPRGNYPPNCNLMKMLFTSLIDGPFFDGILRLDQSDEDKQSGNDHRPIRIGCRICVEHELDLSKQEG